MGDAYSDSRPDRPFPSTADITNGIFLADSYNEKTHSADFDDIKKYLFSLIDWDTEHPMSKKDRRHWDSIFNRAIKKNGSTLLIWHEDQNKMEVIMRK